MFGIINIGFAALRPYALGDIVTVVAMCLAAYGLIDIVGARQAFRSNVERFMGRWSHGQRARRYASIRLSWGLASLLVAVLGFVLANALTIR